MAEFEARAVVVGGGPAGLAAAIALAREGCSVTVADCAKPPIDKSCGEGLMPDSIAALRLLGVELPQELGFAFDGIRFTNGRSSICSHFPNGKGRGVRRIALHELLVRHAEKERVSLVWGAKHVALHERGVLVNGRLAPADFVIGADGQNSRIRAQAGLAGAFRERRRYGFRRHYRVAPWSSCVELHWGPSCQIYITPVAQDEVCVALISRDSGLRLEGALGSFPELRERLGAAAAVSPEMGAVTVSRKLRRVQTQRLALVGDASGSVDAITGQGLCLGFEQALALAAAVRQGRLDTYEAGHGELMRRPQWMGSLLLTLARHDGLQWRALAGLARRPELFQSLVAFHVGAAPFRDFCSWGLVEFGIGFLAAGPNGSGGRACQFARPSKKASC